MTSKKRSWIMWAAVTDSGCSTMFSHQRNWLEDRIKQTLGIDHLRYRIKKVKVTEI